MVQFTAKTIRKGRGILGSPETKPDGLRVAVVGGGFSGFSYSMDIEGAAHADARAHQFGMAQREVDAMIAAETAAGNGHARLGIAGADERQRLVDHVIFVLQMTEHAFPRRNAAVIPAFRIDTIEAEGLQPAGV